MKIIQNTLKIEKNILDVSKQFREGPKKVWSVRFPETRQFFFVPYFPIFCITKFTVMVCFFIENCEMLQQILIFFSLKKFIVFSHYCKVPKFSDTRKLCCNLPKIQTKRHNLRVFCQKNANGKANSEDPHQTAPRGAV